MRCRHFHFALLLLAVLSVVPARGQIKQPPPPPPELPGKDAPMIVHKLLPGKSLKLTLAQPGLQIVSVNKVKGSVEVYCGSKKKLIFQPGNRQLKDNYHLPKGATMLVLRSNAKKAIDTFNVALLLTEESITNEIHASVTRTKNDTIFITTSRHK